MSRNLGMLSKITGPYPRFPVIVPRSVNCTYWQRFMKSIESSLNMELNYADQISNDLKKSDDLKLSVGLTHRDGNIVIRLPKSRVKRRRFKSNRWEGNNQNTNCWNRKVAEEYQNNHIGGYQGNYDKPILSEEVELLSCGNWLISFQEFVSYRHEPTTACKIFDVNKKKYQSLQSREKIEAYYISGVPIEDTFGPTSSIVD